MIDLFNHKYPGAWNRIFLTYWSGARPDDEQEGVLWYRLTDDEWAMPEALIKQEKPKVTQHRKRRAGILLAIDENQFPLTHEQVASAAPVVQNGCAIHV